MGYQCSSMYKSPSPHAREDQSLSIPGLHVCLCSARNLSKFKSRNQIANPRRQKPKLRVEIPLEWEPLARLYIMAMARHADLFFHSGSIELDP